jgi:hypothetical protein
MQRIILVALTFFTPILAVAQTSGDGGCSQSLTNISGLFSFAACIISTSIIPLLVLVATVIFMWGIIKYVLSAPESTERSDGKKFISWGLISLFILVSVWGIIAVLGNTFGLTGGVLIPQLQAS